MASCVPLQTIYKIIPEIYFKNVETISTTFSLFEKCMQISTSMSTVAEASCSEQGS